MKYLQFLLFPFAALYGLVMAVRNICYDKGWFRSHTFDVPVISVGNLTVGGTGKTPHVEYLVRVLQGKKRLAILSRGYKRQTKGFVLADAAATPATLGDEPFQYYQDFPGVTVAVCENRASGIRNLLRLEQPPELILLDDAYQHRRVHRDLNLLLTDYYRLFYKDYVLPAGRLREVRSGAARAHAVVVTKCPETLSEREKLEIQASVGRYTTAPVFFSAFMYGEWQSFGKEMAELPKKVVLVTGIAQPGPLLAYLRRQELEVIMHEQFPDHHAYSVAEAAALAEKVTAAGGNVALLTTRKDAVKLQAPELAGIFAKVPAFYVPIEVKVLENEPALQALIQAAAMQRKRF